MAIPPALTGGVETDISVGLLNADVPPSVGFLPVLPNNWEDYLPADGLSYIQGIGFNQDMKVFGQPTTLNISSVNWNVQASVPFGLSTNWNFPLRSGDSSNPERILIGDQLVLTSHNYFSFWGPNYVAQTDVINQKMHYLSTNNAAETDYQLTPFPLTAWKVIRSSFNYAAAKIPR